MFRKFLRYIQNVNNQSGFTFIEVLIVIVIIGIATSLASSTWYGVLGRWEVTNAQQEAYQGIRQTQVNAQRNKSDWQFSIHETSAGYVEWSSHVQDALPVVWKTLGTKDLGIDADDTTLDSSKGNYYVRFNYKGRLASRTRTLTFVNEKVPNVKRCLVMSTLLGKVRLAQEHEKPNSAGRYCY